MEKKHSTGLWRGMTSVFASLLALIVGLTCIAESNAAIINMRLGITNYRIVDTAQGEKKDSIYFKSEFTSLPEVIEAKNSLACEIASEGAVLLKNENGGLPLDIANEKVTLWGLNSLNTTLGGMIGSSVSVSKDGGQVQYDLVTALTEKGFVLNQDMIDLYSSDPVNGKKGYGRKNGHSLKPSFGKMFENSAQYNVGEAPSDIYTDDVLASADGTVALVVLSRDSSEAADYHPAMTSANKADSYERPLALTENEKAMIELAKEHSTKVVVLLNCDNPIEIDNLKHDEGISAILWTGAPGANGFLGVADVISGKVNPSGHIADTFAVNSASAPAMVNYGVYLYTNSTQAGNNAVLTEENKGDWYLVESEGIYTGYKYYETRYEDMVLGNGNASSGVGTSQDEWNWKNEVSYPFGYGISYTTFTEKLDGVDVAVGRKGTARVTVTNTGNVPGKAVAQLYVQAPYNEGGLEKSAVQLVAFEKTRLLAPGETETVTIEFDPAMFAAYDENSVKAGGTSGAWILESGSYYFAVGNGAHEALNNIIAKKTGTQDNLVSTTEREVIEPENAVEWKLDSTDIETYSANVENRLQFMDINKLIPGSVEYTTRADWTKGWTPVAAITPTEEMMVGLTNNLYTFSESSTEDITWGKAGTRKLIDTVITDDDGKYIGTVDFDSPIWDELLDQITLDEAMQFISQAGDDFENLESIQLAKVYANDGPLGYTGDQVGGYFVRWTDADKGVNPYYTQETDPMATYRMATMPTEPVVASSFNKELVVREGQLLGEDGLWSKESSLFAPGLNLHRTPYCGRNHEYYSEDPVLSAYLGNSLCTGLKSKGTMAEPKHFAFNHQEANRSGLATFMTEQAARENELRSFSLCLSENNAQGLMTSFNRAGTSFAGACSSLLTGILREEWGYEGWIVTDMINGADYMNWRDVTAAGGGGALTTSAYDTASIGAMSQSSDIIAKDGYFQKMMKKNIEYFLVQIANSNAMNGISSTTRIEYLTTWYEYTLYIAIAVISVLTAACLTISVVKDKKSAKKSGKKEEAK